MNFCAFLCENGVDPLFFLFFPPYFPPSFFVGDGPSFVDYFL